MALVGLFLLSWAGAAHVSAAVAKVAAGYAHTIFLRTDGTLWGLGQNAWGQLGDGTVFSRGTAVQVSGAANVAAMAAGDQHTVFLKADGTLWATGWNADGELGDGTTTNRTLPVQVSGGTNVITVAAGGHHTAFIKADGTLWTTGYNDNGQLGDGTTTNRNTPVQVSGTTNVAAIAVGNKHTVFIKTDGTLWAMGDNFSGQLGDGTMTDRSTPVQVSGVTNVAAVAAGGSHTVFLKTDGTLWAMGDNSSGQLGYGTGGNRSTPVQVSGGTNVAAFDAGETHTLFIKTDGTLWAVGQNAYGQLGDGTMADRSTPVQVSGGVMVTAVAAGGLHSVFLKTAGRLWGMGFNSYQQLSSINPSTVAFPVVTPALINQSIAFTPIGAKSVATGSTLNFTISATDADNDPLTCSAANLPSGATFTPATRTFSWAPITTVNPNPSVTFNVTDGFVIISETIVITVIDGTLPSVPILSGTASSPTSVSLTWTTSTDNVGVVQYRVYRDGGQITTTSSTSYSDSNSGLQPGTTYTYTVRAEDGAGNASAHSTPASVKTQYTGAQTRNVTNAGTLATALTEAVSNPLATFTINVAAGTYALGSTPLPNLSISGTKIQGPLSEPYAIIDAAGLSGGVVFNVIASNVTISGLTFRNVATHAINIQPHADSGYVLGCSFYGTGATAAILGRGCANWTVAVNDIHDIAGTTAMAEPAIYFHEGSTNLGIANNQIQDCDRGIGFGAGATENNGSVWIFNNMIADTRTVGNGGPGISVVSTTSGGASIENNTVYQVGSYANAIEYNNNSATIAVRNNLTNRAITGSNSPFVVAATNYTSALASWFNNPNDCDLRLTSAVGSVVDRGTAVSGLTIDIEGDARPTGTAFDIGADEYVQATAPGGGTTTPTSPSAPASSGGGGGGGAPGHWFLGALAVIVLAHKVRGRTSDSGF